MERNLLKKETVLDNAYGVINQDQVQS